MEVCIDLQFDILIDVHACLIRNKPQCLQKCITNNYECCAILGLHKLSRWNLHVLPRLLL